MRKRLPRKALLLIEVSGSSLAKDRGLKNEIYAEAGVPEYWIVNLETHQVEVLTRPTATGYARRVVMRAADVLRPLNVPAVALRVSEIPWGTRKHRKRSR